MDHRIIGCGAANRGDDAAGLLAVRRLRELGIEAYEHNGDGATLIERWQGQDAVILIDAVVTGGIPGAVTVWDAKGAPVTGDFYRSSTHSFGVAEAVKLARVLGRMPRQLLIYGIEGRGFDLGSAPCPQVVAAAEELAQHLASRTLHDAAPNRI
jgi:hydrogenase maturation protease